MAPLLTYIQRQNWSAVLSGDQAFPLLAIDLRIVIGFILGQLCCRFPFINGSRIVDAFWSCSVSDCDYVFFNAGSSLRACRGH
jgi:hypothetical protein